MSQTLKLLFMLEILNVYKKSGCTDQQPPFRVHKQLYFTCISSLFICQYKIQVSCIPLTSFLGSPCHFCLMAKRNHCRFYFLSYQVVKNLHPWLNDANILCTTSGCWSIPAKASAIWCNFRSLNKTESNRSRKKYAKKRMFFVNLSEPIRQNVVSSTNVKFELVCHYKS